MKYRNINYLTILIVFFAALFFFNAAHAFNISSYKPLTKIEFLDEKEFNNKTKLIEQTPFDDPFLEYKIRLTNGFEASNAKLGVGNLATNVSQRVLGVVSRYVSAPIDSLRSSFVVEALELEYEISARNWFISYIITNGLSLEQVSIENDGYVEAIYIEIIKDVTYIVRIKAIKNGPRIVMARYYLPQALYNDNRVLQAQVVDSFTLLNTETVAVEELKSYGFLDQSFMKYPASWQLESPYIRSIDRMTARVFRNTKGDRLDGQINIYISKKNSDKTRSSEIKFYKDKIIFDGYTLGNFLEDQDFEYHEEMKFGVTEVYALNAMNKKYMDYEAWFSFLENKDYYYFIVLYTPERNTTFLSWARNIEAYKIVLKNIQRTNVDPNFMKMGR